MRMRLLLNVTTFESPEIQDYFDQKGTELSHNMFAKIPKKSRFFRYFLSLNEGNLKFKELQIEEKNFHLSHVFFELSDFEESATEKSQKIK